MLSNGENAIISSIEVEHYDEPQMTYNFEVEDFHTYYVGTEGILVHNTCVNFNESNLQHEFSRHAKDFGIEGPWNKANAKLFKEAIQDQVNKATNIMENVMYMKHTPATLYFNKSTGIGVYLNNTDTLLAGWKFTDFQILTRVT